MTALHADPTGTDVEAALQAFAMDLRQHYGARLEGVYLFGSRARGTARPDSDADVAVVLADEMLRFWDEKWALVDLAYDRILESGVHIQAWPFTRAEWEDPSGQPLERLVRSAKRDAHAIGVFS
jgi:predicted nucleotidyltransferase